MSNAHFGELIGLVHLPAPEGHALLEIAVEPALCNRQGVVHGGVLLTLLDVAGLWAGVPLNTTPSAATVSLNSQFLHAARWREDLRLLARAEVIRKSRSLYFSSMSVFASNGGPAIASAQGVYHIISRPIDSSSVGMADVPAH